MMITENGVVTQCAEACTFVVQTNYCFMFGKRYLYWIGTAYNIPRYIFMSR